MQWNVYALGLALGLALGFFRWVWRWGVTNPTNPTEPLKPNAKPNVLGA